MQLDVVVQLSSLYDRLAVFAKQMSAYQAEADAYKARFEARLRELQAAAPKQHKDTNPAQAEGKSASWQLTEVCASGVPCAHTRCKPQRNA